MCIDENDDNVVSKKDIIDYLEYMYRSNDLRYNHYKNLQGLSSTGASSSSADSLGSMWVDSLGSLYVVKEESGSSINDFDCYNIDQMLFNLNTKVNLNVFG